MALRKAGDYDAGEISEPTLRDIYMPPYEAAVKSGVGTLMSAFLDLNGIPASANRRLLTDVLRGEWGFDGFVVSDWDSVRSSSSTALPKMKQRPPRWPCMPG